MAEKAVNVRGDVGKLAAAFKEALEAKDTPGGGGDVCGPHRHDLQVNDGL